MNFEDIIGNEEVKKYLLKSTEQNKFSQSYLFVGTEGIGKLLIAKAFAKKLLCIEQNQKSDCNCKSCKSFEGLNHTDFVLVNEEGNAIKIDQIREITNKMIEQPIISDKKVYILNDCEKMTTEAQNCLLKTLEEPPSFAIIILITSNANLLLNTIKSRCMTIKFADIPNDKLQKYATDKLGMTQMTQTFLKSLQRKYRKSNSAKRKSRNIFENRKSVGQLIHTRYNRFYERSKNHLRQRKH